jgi:endonuclease YncB( thermonuclease family)
MARACAVLASLCCLPALAAPWVIEGRVMGISDGDTLALLDDAKVQHKIRIAFFYIPRERALICRSVHDGAPREVAGE